MPDYSATNPPTPEDSMANPVINLLVVDDSLTNIDALVRALRSGGYVVEGAVLFLNGCPAGCRKSLYGALSLAMIEETGGICKESMTVPKNTFLRCRL